MPDDRIDTTRSFDAPAEVLYNTLTDPDRLYRWLPDRVRGAAGGYRISPVPDRLRVEISPAGAAGWTGSAQAADSSAGGSTLRVRLEMPRRDTGGEPPGGGRSPAGTAPGSDDATYAAVRTISPSEARTVIEQALAALQREVAENLTPG